MNMHVNRFLTVLMLPVIRYSTGFDSLNARERLPDESEPPGIALETVEYPFPVNFLELEVQHRADRLIPNSMFVELHDTGHTLFFEAFDKIVNTLVNLVFRVGDEITI